MALHLIKRRGKIVGMTMTIAEMKVTYKLLTGKKAPDGDLQGAGKELMENYTEQQIKDAVAKFNHDDYMTGDY